ncbi:LCP family protein [Patescibacteria group bacterium]|nr:LCP family protein [Patescibacteria group bacterium]
MIDKKQIFIKASLLALPLSLTMLAITVIAFVNYKLNIFVKTAGINKKDFIQTLKTGWRQTPVATASHKNLLVLGLDSLTTRGNSAPLTDSMMLISLNLENGQITTLPLPRDLWSDEYQTKINALYTYGLDRYPKHPEKFPQEVVSALTSIPIHHTVVISMSTVAQLVDLVGGVEVEVKQSFIDEEFPRTDVDVTTETDPKKLYETIEFQAGKQLMDGATSLKYLRSRHGNNNQNTDNDRSKRQQAVIQALAKKLINAQTLLDTSLAGQLYKYYLENFSQNLSPAELIATARKLLPVRNNISLKNESLSVYPDDPEGIIEHPLQYLYDGQWVYVIRDNAEFKTEIQAKLINRINQSEMQ